MAFLNRTAAFSNRLAMKQLNEQFLLRYRLRIQQLRRRILEGIDPTIIRLGDTVILLHRQRRENRLILSDDYQRWKELCHVPVAIYLWLGELVGRKFEKADVDALEALMSSLADKRAGAARSEEQIILDESLAVLRCAQRARSVASSSLKQLGCSVEAPIRGLMYLAARDELTTLDACMSDWTRGFDAEQWRALHVLICANHQARYKEGTKLYFQRLLGEHHGPGAEGEEQILYVENALTEDEAVNLLATHCLDREIGAAFLRSPAAMQRNILGDAAQRVVEDLFTTRQR